MSAITGETTIARPDKDGNTTICKVRGITLNYKNSLTINFDTIKDMVINNRDDVYIFYLRHSTKNRSMSHGSVVTFDTVCLILFCAISRD
jgi:hypothetical protein